MNRACFASVRRSNQVRTAAEALSSSTDVQAFLERAHSLVTSVMVSSVPAFVGYIGVAAAVIFFGSFGTETLGLMRTYWSAGIFMKMKRVQVWKGRHC